MVDFEKKKSLNTLFNIIGERGRYRQFLSNIQTWFFTVFYFSSFSFLYDHHLTAQICLKLLLHFFIWRYLINFVTLIIRPSSLIILNFVRLVCLQPAGRILQNDMRWQGRVNTVSSTNIWQILLFKYYTNWYTNIVNIDLFLWLSCNKLFLIE